VLRSLIPPAFEVDAFDGEAWLGVVPFEMVGVRPRGLPAVSRLSDFAELNVRTYVRHRGKQAVYFFSLDAASRPAVRIARSLFHLPYFDAHMAVAESDAAVHYHSYRTHRGARPATFVGAYRPTGPVAQSEPGTLDHWLTERYAFGTTDRQGRVMLGEIHHPPWSLQPAEAEVQTNTMAEAAGIELPDTPPLLHYAERIDMLGWAPKRAE
jgi:uncharacterized protein YqjF (DUF2071 family)